MIPDLWTLYEQMLISRLFEQAVARLWTEGRISGEMHLGVGEEAIAAGVVLQLREGDAMALDHRGTPPLLMRGVDPVSLLRELLGCDDGLCGGRGGHMHLFSPELLAASSGIVGAAGPTAAGFALAAQVLRPGSIAVGFFGEGAMNQGMLLESFNLTAAWNLPALFVCKQNFWAVATRSSEVSRGDLLERARSLGLHAVEVDGREVLQVWNAAHELVERVRNGQGPAFLLARCAHLEGHFLGDRLLEMARQPARAMRQNGLPLLKAVMQPKGASLAVRLRALQKLNSAAGEVTKQARPEHDPLAPARRWLAGEDELRLRRLEDDTRQSVDRIVELALMI